MDNEQWAVGLDHEGNEGHVNGQDGHPDVVQKEGEVEAC
jgi:hypothetical protein